MEAAAQAGRCAVARGGSTVAAAFAIALGLAACALHDYRPAPLDTSANADRLAARSLDDPGVRAALAAAGVPVPAWPLPAWTLAALTVAAIHLDPGVAAARADWRTRVAGIETAGARANPLVAPEVAYDTDPDDPDDPPWTVGLAVELPLPRADKSAARVARAVAVGEAARHDIARAGWQRRRAVREAVLACNAATLLSQRTGQQIALHEEIVTIYQRRRELGESSLTEVTLARQGLDGALLDEAGFSGALESCRGALAGALGISYPAARALPLDARELRLDGAGTPAPEALRRAALHGRADLRAALAGYAAAEADLRLEIARQFPDITVSPALFWDQGGLVWSLGASLAAAVLNRHEGPIAEARQARDAAAQAVLAVQGRVLAQLAEADAEISAARGAHAAAADLAARAESRLELARRRQEGGEIGRLDVIQAELDLSRAQTALLERKLALLRLRGRFEDIVESPLVGDPATALDVVALAESANSWFEPEQ